MSHEAFCSTFGCSKQIDETCDLPCATMEQLDSLLCPIFREVMGDPVSNACGNTYERAALEEWFRRGNATDPLTNQRLESLSITPNQALKATIAEWKDKNKAFTESQERLQAQVREARAASSRLDQRAVVPMGFLCRMTQTAALLDTVARCCNLKCKLAMRVAEKVCPVLEYSAHR